MSVDVRQRWPTEPAHWGKSRAEQQADRLYTIGLPVASSASDIRVKSFCASCFSVSPGFSAHIFGDSVVLVWHQSYLR